MSDKQFNKRYSIEYLHPGNIDTAETKKKSVIVPLIILSVLVTTGFLLWKQGVLDQFIQSEGTLVTNDISQSSLSTKTVESTESVTATLNPSDINQKTKNNSVPPPHVVKVSLQNQTSNYINSTGKKIFFDQCSFCHGKNGEGNLQGTYPKLQGQNSAYILLQLKRMRDGQRLNVNPAMFKIISKMDNTTFKKLADYVAQIPASNNRLAKNELLSKKLQELSNQLSIEKKKNSMLSEQLKKNLEISESISKLYDNAEKIVPQNDKSFLKIVEEERKRLNSSSDNLIKNEDAPSVPINQTAATSIVAVATPQEDKNSNTLEISTASQMDKIVSAINNKTVGANSASVSRATTKRRIIVTTIESNVAQKAIGLQSQINQLVSEEDVPKTKFTKALEKENKVRKNSVRSVVVKKGETLWGIAKRAYGTGFKYPKILKANPKLKKGQNVHIYAGQILRVPR